MSFGGDKMAQIRLTLSAQGEGVAEQAALEIASLRDRLRENARAFAEGETEGADFLALLKKLSSELTSWISVQDAATGATKGFFTSLEQITSSGIDTALKAMAAAAKEVTDAWAAADKEIAQGLSETARNITAAWNQADRDIVQGNQVAAREVTAIWGAVDKGMTDSVQATTRAWNEADKEIVRSTKAAADDISNTWRAVDRANTDATKRATDAWRQSEQQKAKGSSDAARDVTSAWNQADKETVRNTNRTTSDVTSAWKTADRQIAGDAANTAKEVTAVWGAADQQMANDVAAVNQAWNQSDKEAKKEIEARMVRLESLQMDGIRMQTELAQGTDKASKQAAYSILYLSHAFQDLTQSGIGATINNIPLVVQSLTGSAGLAGAAMIVGASIDVLYRNWDKLMKALGATDPLKEASRLLADMEKRLEDIEKHMPLKLGADYSLLQQARGEINRLRMLLGKGEGVMEQRPEMQERVGRAAAEAIAEFGGAKDGLTGGQNLANLIIQATATPRMLELQRRRAEAEQQMEQFRGQAGPAAEGMRKTFEHQVELIQKEISQEEAQIHQDAKQLLGEVANGQERAIVRLTNLYDLNKQLFERAGVGPEFRAALQQARPAELRAVEFEEWAEKNTDQFRKDVKEIHDAIRKQNAEVLRQAGVGPEAEKAAVAVEAARLPAEILRLRGPGTLTRELLEQAGGGAGEAALIKRAQERLGPLMGQIGVAPNIADRVANAVAEEVAHKVRQEVTAAALTAGSPAAGAQAIVGGLVDKENAAAKADADKVQRAADKVRRDADAAQRRAERAEKDATLASAQHAAKQAGASDQQARAYAGQILRLSREQDIPLRQAAMEVGGRVRAARERQLMGQQFGPMQMGMQQEHAQAQMLHQLALQEQMMGYMGQFTAMYLQMQMRTQMMARNLHMMQQMMRAGVAQVPNQAPWFAGLQ